MLASVRSARRVGGSLRLPGDKSVSHRALILNSIASGLAVLENLSRGADVRSTAACLEALGVEVGPGYVAGSGLRGLRAAAGPLDCGNSGTTMRLLAGLLAAQEFESVLTGDASLSRRPMERVAAPLRELGVPADAGPPLRVGGGGAAPRAAAFSFEVPSAQVKSALLLCGLYGEETSVEERVPTRDHTERMLAAMGAPVEVAGNRVTVRRASSLRALNVAVPGDLSAAAFWLVAAGVRELSSLRLPAVGVNPTRSRLLDVLQGAGLQIAVENPRFAGVEPVADLVVGSASGLRPLSIGASQAAELIDELPVLAVAAALIPGRSEIRGARELRIKESDRIAAMAAGLSAMGAAVEELEDGWVIEGGRPLQGARVESFDDHRVAMALAVAGTAAASGVTEIEGAECVDISYPGFWDDLEAVTRA